MKRQIFKVAITNDNVDWVTIGAQDTREEHLQHLLVMGYQEVSAEKEPFGLRLWKREELARWTILVECPDVRKDKAYSSNSFVLYVFSNHKDLWTTLLSTLVESVFGVFSVFY